MECLDSKNKVDNYRETYVGWRLKGKLIHPLDAYVNYDYWFDDFCSQFPLKAEKMKKYSDEHNWGKQSHYFHWKKAVLWWLNKNA